MAEIVVCGGGVIGLAGAMMLARDGHRVTLLERDPGEVPDTATEAWERWERPGVPQFRQPHNLFPGYCGVLRDELPEVLDGLYAAGGNPVDMIGNLPPAITDRAPRPGDEKFRFVTGRRPMVEQVHARAADAEAGVAVRRGVKVEGLLGEPAIDGGPVRVHGVRTAEGDVDADLVIDAMGRRTAAAAWLEALGGRAPTTTSQECAFTYYTRFYTGSTMPTPMAPLVSVIGTFIILTLTGDNDTWSVTLWAPGGDAPLKRFADPDVFEAVVRACPLHAHWLDGQPITDVLPMGGILDKYRRFVVDGTPVATGLLAVGDAWACTNPSAGRGLSVGLHHARRLRDVVGALADRPDELAREWDEVTEREFAPWYWDQLEADQARLDQMAEVREGRRDVITATSPLPPRYAKAMLAVAHDPDVYRAVMETLGCISPADEVFSRPEVWERVEAAAGEPFSIPGPDRAQLLELVS